MRFLVLTDWSEYLFSTLQHCSCWDGRGKEPTKGKWLEPWHRKTTRSTEGGRDEELPMPIFKNRNPSLTPLESCASYETEEEEKLRGAPPGLSDPVGEDVKETGWSRQRRDPPAPKVQANEGHEVVRGIRAQRARHRLKDQTRLSILSWNAAK